MSEILTIDTAAGIQQVEKLDPLQVHGEDYFMLQQRIPEYTGGFPAPAMVNLAKRLKMTMKLYSGLGLSANQCGVAERMFAIGTDQFQMVCINPKVIDESDDWIKDKEGCLSFPGLFLNVERPSWIQIEYTTEFGEVKQARLDGLSARCYLHELDHLNGIRYTDYIKPLALKMARQRAQKLVKKIIRNHKNGKRQG
jgi:peptide deformylase